MYMPFAGQCPAELRKMNCPACGWRTKDDSDTFQPLEDITRGSVAYRLFGCPECGTAFAEPRTSAGSAWYASIGEHYGWRWEFDQTLQALYEADRARIIEIGCGEGILLERIRTRHEVWGVDINQSAVVSAREKGLHVFIGTIEEFIAAHPGLYFDYILFFHLLEHLEDPRSFLCTVQAILKPGGRIYFSVPNDRRCTLRLGHESWDFPPHHLTRFSRDGVVQLLTGAGYHVVAMRDEPNRISSWQWARLFAELALGKLTVGRAGTWPKLARVVLKVGLFPIGYLHFAAHRQWRQASPGGSLYLIAAL